jgi:hypothetical protein
VPKIRVISEELAAFAYDYVEDLEAFYEQERRQTMAAEQAEEQGTT